MPHGIEISTSSQSFYFRAASKRDQQEWLAALTDGVELATENELFEFAEMIITDEETRRQKRENSRDDEAVLAKIRDGSLAGDDGAF